MDVCLVEMPFRLAVLGPDRADVALEAHQYAHWYIGGHSLGGVIAASYAAKHSDRFEGVILLASYSTAGLDDSLTTILIYGSEDQVLNREEYEENLVNVPASHIEQILEGGNHAQFGSYGAQTGDGTPRISQEQQISQTVDLIIQNLLQPDA